VRRGDLDDAELLEALDDVPDVGLGVLEEMEAPTTA